MKIAIPKSAISFTVEKDKYALKVSTFIAAEGMLDISSGECCTCCTVPVEKKAVQSGGSALYS
jgi:hypothetical protein